MFERLCVTTSETRLSFCLEEDRGTITPSLLPPSLLTPPALSSYPSGRGRWTCISDDENYLVLAFPTIHPRLHVHKADIGVLREIVGQRTVALMGREERQGHFEAWSRPGSMWSFHPFPTGPIIFGGNWA